MGIKLSPSSFRLQKIYLFGLKKFNGKEIEMKKKTGFLCLFILLLSSPMFAWIKDDFVIKSGLFKSFGQDALQESDVVVSIFSVPVLVPFHPNYIQLEKINIYHIKNELQKIYKIENIDHLASGIIVWDGKKSQLDGIILVKESSYPMHFSPQMISEGSFNLRVQISHPRGESSPLRREESMFETEMVMRTDTPYVLGFPSEGSQYFLSISIAKKKGGQFLEDDYMQAIPEKEIPAIPELIHKIIPEYPPSCKKENIGGKVIVQISIDEQGFVTNVDILNSPHSDLGIAATNAIKQWKFEPVKKNGNPISVKFPVIVDFKSTEGSSEKKPEK
jgi:TonB family protein